MIEAWKNGGTLIYEDPGQYGYLYIIFSLILFMFLHDTYFYWTHRWMHRPSIFKVFHKVHHQSMNPTPWAAFSFHPTEGVVEAVIIPLLVFSFRFTHGSVVVCFDRDDIFGVVNHCGFEIYPKSWDAGAICKNYDYSNSP
ncbi:MAG: sterol desaturase family protein [Bdellovibrionales bacterium]